MPADTQSIEQLLEQVSQLKKEKDDLREQLSVRNASFEEVSRRTVSLNARLKAIAEASEVRTGASSDLQALSLEED